MGQNNHPFCHFGITQDSHSHSIAMLSGLSAVVFFFLHIFHCDSADVSAGIDWRSKEITTGVWKERGCNSSWAIATANSVESQHAKKTGELVLLSIQELIDCANKTTGIAGCAYGSVKPALEWLKQAPGLMHNDEYLYTAFDVDICRLNSTRPLVSIQDYVQIKSGDEEALKDAVTNIGPIASGIDRLPSFRAYKSGVYYDPECNSGESDLNHWITVEGYGTENGQDYWLVKNSAGVFFGEDGYIKMARNKGNHCGIATSAFYPIL